jgi:adenine-specific DNA methylase|tara:strand:- start:10549 stop:11652 length:1104 start_codon:yes stop_codon:yes gene_type:complete
MPKTKNPVCPVDISDDGDQFENRLNVIQSRLELIKNPYIGGKRDLISFIFSMIRDNNIAYNSVLDLFCGSAAVSFTAKELGKNVWANDLMLFCIAGAYTFLDNKDDKYISDEEMSYLIQNENKDRNSFMEENWSVKAYKKKNHRFSVEECKSLDNYYANAVEMEASKFYHALTSIIHYVMDHCHLGGKPNHGRVVAEYNHRVQHSRNNGAHIPFQRMFNYNHMLNDHVGDVFISCKDAKEVPSMDLMDIDLCYLDPPYGDTQSDYSTLYDVFESYIQQDMVHNEDGKKFLLKKTYVEHFEDVLRAVQHIPWLVVSYNGESWAKIEDIKDYISQYRDIVDIGQQSKVYKSRGRNRAKNPSTEYVIIAK